MAIQHRRGVYANLDKTKLKAGELAVVQSGDTTSDDGKGLYVSFNGGDATRMATAQEVEEKYSSLSEEIANLKVSGAIHIPVFSSLDEVPENYTGLFVIVGNSGSITEEKITQSGDILTIVSGVTAAQYDDILTIA